MATRLKILVVGDSFMSRDDRFPRSHWSELIPNVDFIMAARLGASNGMIFRQLIEHIHTADSVVIGMTNSQRLELDPQFCHPDRPCRSDWDYVTTAQDYHFSSEQKELMRYWLGLINSEITLQSSLCQLVGMINTALQCDKKVVFTLGLLEKELDKFSVQWVDSWLQKFKPYHLQKNLGLYPEVKTSDQYPLHHVDDLAWQKSFADEVWEKLNHQTNR